MNFDQVMSQLGADHYPVTSQQQQQIERDGYVVLPSLFDRRQVAQWRTELDALVTELKLGITEFDGGYRIHDLIGRQVFDAAWSHPMLLAVARAWLKQEFKPMSVNYRCPLPGGGNQTLHSDQTPTPYCQAIIALCDIDLTNGAPRVVPGTHRLKTVPQDEMADTKASHPREIKFTGPAGSAFLFDGNLWHSGTQNDSAAPRPVLHVGFMSRYANSSGLERQRGAICPTTYDRMSPALRNFLDFRVVDPEYTKSIGTGAGLAPLVKT